MHARPQGGVRTCAAAAATVLATHITANGPRHSAPGRSQSESAPARTRGARAHVRQAPRTESSAPALLSRSSRGVASDRAESPRAARTHARSHSQLPTEQPDADHATRPLSRRGAIDPAKACVGCRRRAQNCACQAHFSAVDAALFLAEGRTFPAAQQWVSPPHWARRPTPSSSLKCLALRTLRQAPLDLQRLSKTHHWQQSSRLGLSRVHHHCRMLLS
mmetsp:Transcript_21452/g.45283  ORF Transcript_21452/g.45283 Transcript_21452/m.45283 type:complete len:219 (-) Transcript_21452:241-897(-)